MKQLNKEQMLEHMEALMKERYPSIEDIINDPLFIEEVETIVKKMTEHKQLRKPAPQGMVYKRDWYDKVRGWGNEVDTYCLSRIELIWNKKSTLPTDLRSGIKRVCDEALNQVLFKLCLERMKEVEA